MSTGVVRWGVDPDGTWHIAYSNAYIMRCQQWGKLTHDPEIIDPPMEQTCPACRAIYTQYIVEEA